MKNFKLPGYITTSNRIINVVGTINSTKDFIDGKGYIYENTEIVLIYSDKKPEKGVNQYPYFWPAIKKSTSFLQLKLEDGRTFYMSSPSSAVISEFHASNLRDISLERIELDLKNTDEELYNEEMIQDMNAASSVFVPTIKESDDFLKKIIKTVILEKGVNIHRYKHKAAKAYLVPNMIQALNGDTKMSVLYLAAWIELLGIDITITITDNGKDQDPLPEPLIYMSSRDRILKESELNNNDTDEEKS